MNKDGDTDQELLTRYWHNYTMAWNVNSLAGVWKSELRLETVFGDFIA